MKFDYIVIPTLGRCDKQVTYNQLPAKWQKITRFVVQPHEYETMCELYGNEKVLCLPKEINTIAATREWIYYHFQDYIYWSFDDDLKFRIKEPADDGRLTSSGHPAFDSRFFTEQDFDEMFAWAIEQLESGYCWGGSHTSTIIIDANQYPIKKNTRVIANFFFNGPALKDVPLEWNRVQWGEDFDLMMQLLTQGYSNIVTVRYGIVQGSQKTGGCHIKRTIEAHNESQLILQSLWPEFISITEKELEDGQIRYNLFIKTSEAYKSSQRPKTHKLF